MQRELRFQHLLYFSFCRNQTPSKEISEICAVFRRALLNVGLRRFEMGLCTWRKPDANRLQKKIVGKGVVDKQIKMSCRHTTTVIPLNTVR